ncbi:MAG: sigma-54-dependent Fis family transcriptional regulator [Acidobacteria bacterium]|nr:sigma-54-dependent Fis family transcriptional regulator [Acidobacteriota bacterium]
MEPSRSSVLFPRRRSRKRRGSPHILTSFVARCDRVCRCWIKSSAQPGGPEMSTATAISHCVPMACAGAEAIGVLIVSSNQGLRCELRERLRAGRWSVQEAGSGAEALEKLSSEPMSVMVLDPGLPDLRVDDFKQMIQNQFPAITLIPVNPHTGQPVAVSASPDSISLELVRQIGAGAALNSGSPPSVRELDREGLKVHNAIPEFVGRAVAVHRMNSLVHMVAPRDTTVLITGESGTGKDLVARAVHHLSPRRQKPFVIINCAAIPEALLEAELFGFVKGAFTGAVQSRIGRIHAAQGGTLFLDEIGDLPLGLQSKLLRFLEQGEVQRLGSTDTFRVDVRVVAATNCNLRQLVQQRCFREDLFYRLSIFPVELAPLRERVEDIDLLAEYFLAKFCANQVTLAPEATELLHQHIWPGNVRELRNVMERASILAGTERLILPQHILI